MTKHPHQTCLRMPVALKEDMTSICDQLSINESDFMRKAIADFVKKLNESPDTEHRHLFA